MSRFKEIEGYEGYLIYDNGEVYSNKRNIFLSSRINCRGYRYVNLCKSGKYKSVSIHRIVAKHFIDNPNGYNVINHIDGVKTNNDYKNLEWCTTSYNIRHAIKNNLMKPRRGEKCNLSKLTKKEVDEIRCLFMSEKYNLTELGKLFNVNRRHISLIVKNIIWIDDNYIFDKNKIKYNRKI